MKAPVRFALLILALLVAATAVLGFVFYRNPIGISLWIARASLERMDLEKETVTIDRGEQVYYRGGSGPTPVVLLHGMGHQASSWVNVVPTLLTRYPLIVPDLAGHGESAPADGPLTLQDSLRGVEAILEKAAPDVPVTLVGNSMGAWISLLYALEHPERVERLVLVNGGGLTGELKDAEGPLTLLPTTREEAARLVRALSPEGTEAPAGFVLDDLIEKIAAGPAPRQIAGTDLALLLDQRLGEVEVGVDILWGVGDQLLPLAYARRLDAGLERSRLHELPGCGHIPHQQCPGLFVETLFAALDEEPPSAPSDPAEPAAVSEEPASEEPATETLNG